ncbi:preprotein translocase subunit YajC [Myroides ceti]|uniref:Sec translocon accessory complex subunit YajC n=1 Tax=Paenimyroides ceti TaxID=395087 RepID=A0ABT8CUC0_9FLAO|nr:preprotein translocase subunit YajC [Paenimyroides ceti]MDN3707741.1 preprotein translocase subunit YajC [Paenimyroides ceti]
MDQNLIMIFVFVAFIIFFMILPQRKRMKQEKAFEASLKVGDKIITKSGIHGRISEMGTDGTVIVETMAGKLKMEKAAISIELTQKLNQPEKVSK